MQRSLDRLTWIWDRNTCIESITRHLKKGTNICVALMDLDFFTNIDSKIGSNAGDRLLFSIAKYLSGMKKVTVGRYGGDEFIIIFYNTEENDVKKSIYDIHEGLKKKRFTAAVSIYRQLRITASIGVAFSSDNINDPFLILKAAETALAVAKKKGRNRIEIAPDAQIRIINGDIGVSTVAGGGLKGDGLDGKSAFRNEIAEPYGVDIDSYGELYIVDRGNHKIKKVNKQGSICTVAGSKCSGFLGDDGMATEALLCKPSGIAIDKNNCIYIADTGNHRIRKIDETGIIKTIAGCGEDGWEGDGDRAVLAKLSRPGGVVVDKLGNVYTNDYGNNVIRMISAEGLIFTAAGSGAYGFSGDGGNACEASMDRPYGLTITPDGSVLYFADYGNHCIREVDMKSKIIRTLCGNGEAGYSGDMGDCSKAQLNGPFWTCLWREKYLLIADGNNNCIRIVDLVSRQIDTLAGGLQGGYRDDADLRNARFNTPAGLVADSCKDILYVADYANNSIRRILLNNISIFKGL